MTCPRCRHYLCDNCEMQHICHQFGEISNDSEMDMEIHSLEVIVADAPKECVQIDIDEDRVIVMDAPTKRVHIDINEDPVSRSGAQLQTALYTIVCVLAVLQLESYRRSLCSFLCQRRHRRKKRRTVATQSQCTYTSVRGNAQGKFRPSGIALEGVFVE